ncbi:HTH-type transcriptional regulator NimR [Pseudomonas fluorescens]|uniref:HTH-type transcriptional regulator NimR n=1 Tax=Pseudomonas fluorescens TaxID=294 RepID=A0A5E6SD68_PSEFL|nr:helix-turn-helix transcriptional regulator [Pseudomonas fluorescens]VVM78571.1 HTH-type transcriptional regulator NimR [Pseudomonas fluorescens]
MRNIPIHQLDATPRAVVAIGSDYPHGFLHPSHTHRRAQLLYGAKGVMKVVTKGANWIVPPQRAVWIPPQVAHEVLYFGVSTRSLYIEPASVPSSKMDCQVISVSPLMRQLLMESVDVPLEYEEEGRDGALMNLLLHELARATQLPLHIPLPIDPRLLLRCQAFLQAPDIHQSPQEWARDLHMSERSFSRLFREQTGMSFGQWRQRACVVLALAKLSAGVSITRIALDFGYESPAAFSTMFRRILGQAPTAYLEDHSR